MVYTIDLSVLPLFRDNATLRRGCNRRSLGSHRLTLPLRSNWRKPVDEIGLKTGTDPAHIYHHSKNERTLVLPAASKLLHGACSGPLELIAHQYCSPSSGTRWQSIYSFDKNLVEKESSYSGFITRQHCKSCKLISSSWKFDKFVWYANAFVKRLLVDIEYKRPSFLNNCRYGKLKISETTWKSWFRAAIVPEDVPIHHCRCNAILEPIS